MDQSQDLTFRDYIRPVLRLKWVIAAVVLFITAATYGYENHKPKIYNSSTSVLLLGDTSVIGQTGSVLTDRTVADQVAILTSPAVAKRVARQLGHPTAWGSYAGSINAAGTQNTDFISIRSTWWDARGAARIANAFSQAFINLRTEKTKQDYRSAIAATQTQLNQLGHNTTTFSQRQQLQETLHQLRVALATSTAQAEQISPAVIPGAPSSPHPRKAAILAFFVALVGTIALAYAISMFDRRLRRPDDIADAYGLPVLAVLPDTEQRAGFVDGRAAVPAPLQEPLRHLRTNIRLSRDDPPRVMLVTSAVPKEGKSTVVRNLAIVFREAGARVAVVDADLRRPSLSALYDRERTPGLTDVLVGDIDLEDALASVPVQAHGLQTLARLSGDGVSTAVQTDAEFLDLLPAGPTPADPETVLASKRLRELVERLLEDHDIVLLDSAPILNVSDTIPLTHMVDAMILVARVDEVTRDNARRLRETLGRLSHARQIGVVVNGVRSQEGYSYGGYGTRT